MIKALTLAMLVLCAGRVAAEPVWSATTFTSDAGETVMAESTTITVPQRHEAPSGGAPGGATITLPVVRLRSTARHPGPPIIYLAGGPGNSGLKRARQELFPVFLRLRESADVVIFDQRGTGEAQPSLMLTGTYGIPSDKPMRSPEVLARLTQIAHDGAAEMTTRGIDLSAYNTAENAEDIESLRLALGAPKIALWGHSYGSHLGLAYIKAHGDHVARAVLGGVNDLGARWRLPADGDALLMRIDAAVKADPRMAQRIPDFLGTVRRVMAHLDAHPEIVTVSGKSLYLGREELQVMIALNAGDLGFVRGLPAMFAAMDKGDYSRAPQAVQQVRGAPLDTAMRQGMHIASGVSPARSALIEAQRPGSLMGDAINFPYNQAAFSQAWGVADLGEAFRAPAPSDVPVLFMNGEFDGRTSVREARETASRFRHGCFSEMGGVSHDFYGYSPKVVEAMLAFYGAGACPPPRIEVLAAEFRGPDDADLLKALGVTLTFQGQAAAVAQMRQMAAAKTGPLFNAATARTAGQVAENQLKNPQAAVALLEAADEIWPHDFSITRQLAMLYRKLGDKPKALAAFQALKAINPLTPGVDKDIASVS